MAWYTALSRCKAYELVLRRHLGSTKGKDMRKSADVAILGLGRMGKPIARRLLNEIEGLRVWNRTPTRAEELGELGAQVAVSPAQAAAATTLTVLTDLDGVEEVLRGPEGLISGWQRRRIAAPVLVVHGTVSPVGVQDLAEQLRPQGVEVVDAPLSGGVAGAVSGRLSVMVGAEPSTFERLRPLLQMVGRSVTHLGPVGAGQSAKACNQVVVAATVAALAEAMLLADRAGLERSDLADVLSAGLANSEVLRQKRDRWTHEDFEGGGSAQNQLKDLKFVEEATRSWGLDLPIARTVTQIFEGMVAAGDGALDHSAVIRTLAAGIGQADTAR